MAYDIGKRVLDIIGAIVGIIIFSPLMIACAIWIKLVSPEGPVLADIPDRVGKGGKEFRMYKFRSMIPNAHDFLINNPELYKKYKENNYKLENDPRWIKGAGFMRKVSIDEMPQFFNVLLGQMSIVGPRAYYPFELEKQISDNVTVKPFVDEALTVKPGLTGPWQIGGRSEMSFLERIKIDASYAKTRSLMYDIIVILKTPMAVLRARGAY
jgi:lipopolysaccharide/colanic/teichoic acid biosynthesis glycosyltransferase